MKTTKNYRFVLTVLDNAQLETGENRIANDEVSGERMPFYRAPQRLLPYYLQEPEVSRARAGASRENNRF